MDQTAGSGHDVFVALRLDRAAGRSRRVSERDHGEASVFAVSELLDGVALTDDQKATKVARANGLNVHGTIWLLAQLYRDGKIAEAEAGNLIDMLRGSGMRLPCTGAQFGSFATKHGLL